MLTSGIEALVSAPPPSGWLPAGHAAKAETVAPAPSGVNRPALSEYCFGFLAHTTRMVKLVAPAVGLLTSTIQNRSAGNELAMPMARLEPLMKAPPPRGTLPFGHSTLARVWASALATWPPEVRTVRPLTPAWALPPPSVGRSRAARARAGRRRREVTPRRYGVAGLQESV